jgi:hypothetical protein
VVEEAFEEDTATVVLAPTTGFNSGASRSHMPGNQGFGGAGSMLGGQGSSSGGGVGRQTSFRGLLAAPLVAQQLQAALQSPPRSGAAQRAGPAAGRQLRQQQLQANSAVDNIDAGVGDSLEGTSNAFRVAGFGRGLGGDRFGGGGAPGGFVGRRRAAAL